MPRQPAPARPTDWSRRLLLAAGTENSVGALIVGRHGEVVSHYSFDEHTMVPDVFLVGTARWQTFTPDQQTIIREAARVQ